MPVLASRAKNASQRHEQPASHTQASQPLHAPVSRAPCTGCTCPRPTRSPASLQALQTCARLAQGGYTCSSVGKRRGVSVRVANKRKRGLGLHHSVLQASAPRPMTATAASLPVRPHQCTTRKPLSNTVSTNTSNSPPSYGSCQFGGTVQR